MKALSIAPVALAALAWAAAALAQDPVNIKTTDTSVPVSRLSVTDSAGVGLLASVRVDLARFQMGGSGIINVGTYTPGTPSAGDFRYDASGILQYWDGSAPWVTLETTGGGSGSYLKRNATDTSTASIAGYLYTFTNSNAAGTGGLSVVSSGGIGINGQGPTYGVYGTATTGGFSSGVFGENAAAGGVGVQAYHPGVAIGQSYGLIASVGGGVGGAGNSAYAVYAEAMGPGGTTTYGIYATASGGATNWAGYFSGNVNITADVVVMGTSKLYGATALGDLSSDTITFTGRVNSNVLPSTNGTLDLGSTTQRWQNLYLSGDVLNSSGSSIYLKRNATDTSSASPAAGNFVYDISSTSTGAASGVMRIWNDNVAAPANTYYSAWIESRRNNSSGAGTVFNWANYGRAMGISTSAGSSVDNRGVIGQANATPTAGTTTNIGVDGMAGNGTTNYGVYGEANGTTTNYGLFGIATGAGTTNYGVYATAVAATTNWAGYFAGNVNITGNTTLGDALTDSLTVSASILNGTAFYFEGATVDGVNRTQLAITDPTAVRIIVLPNASGTVALGTGTTNYATFWSGTNTLGSEQYLNVSRGGTGLGTTPTNGQLLIGNGTNYTLATLAEATAYEVAVTNAAGSITLGFDYTATLAGNPALAAGRTAFASTGLIFEGSIADTFEGLLTVTNPTADWTWTLPAGGGTFPVGTGTANYNAYWTATNTLGSEQYVAMSRGGTNAGLTASNGAVVYSTATALALSGVGTSGSGVLISGGAGAPTWGNSISGSLNPQWSVTTTSAAAGAAAISGVNNAAAQVYGVLGSTSSTSVNASGVRGFASAATGSTNGVWGETASSAGIGVYGRASNATGLGGYFVNSAASGAGAGYAVWGQTAQSGSLAAGVVGDNSNASGTGVVGGGQGAGGTGLAAGQGGAFYGVVTGVYAGNSSLGVSQAIYSNNGGNIVRVNYYNGATQYKIQGAGTMPASCAVPNLDGEMVIMHSPETPEFYFMDYGTGTLKDGAAHIDLDPIFAKNVVINDKHPLRVIVQIVDDESCKGVVVKNRTADGFDVVEIAGGKSNASFVWNVICNVADAKMANGKTSKLADLRFERGPEPEKTIESLPPRVDARSPDSSPMKSPNAPGSATEGPRNP